MYVDFHLVPLVMFGLAGLIGVATDSGRRWPWFCLLVVVASSVHDYAVEKPAPVCRPAWSHV